jgi:hypothetical protein
MPSPPEHRMRVATALLALAIVFSFSTPAFAQRRTDVVTLANGDRITGEIIRLERGRLEFKTDDAGTLYLEWDKLQSVVTNRLVEVVVTDGRLFLGTLGPADVRTIAVVATEGTERLVMSQVTTITPIGTSFWRKLDGSFDAGFSYTKSSDIAQLNLQSDTVYRRPGFQARLTASATQVIDTEDGTSDDRAYVEMSYVRYRWQRWLVSVVGRFETNESLGLELRSQVGGATGPRLVNSNRAQVGLAVGAVVNEERGTDVGTTENFEGLVVFRASYFTYDRPKTNLDINLQLYPSFSDTGRVRLQLDTSAKREVWADFYLSASLYYTHDNRPPNPDADKSDVGVVMSIGWSY